MVGKILAIAASAAMALSTSECEQGQKAQNSHAQVCVSSTADKSGDTFRRRADADCEYPGKAGARWRYYSSGIHIPKIGQGAPAHSGSWDRPESGQVVRIPAKGGTAREVVGGQTD